MKYVSIFFNSLCLALALGIAMFSNNRLQMAFNTGYIFWGGLVLLIILFAVALRKDSYGIGIRGSIVSAMVLILTTLVYLGPTKSILVVPASFIREGLHTRIPFNTINIILLVLLVGCFLLLLWRAFTNPKPLKVNPDPSEAKVERTGRIARWIAFGVLSLIIIICSCVTPIRNTMGEIFALLSSGDINAVVEYLRGYGPQAAAVSACLMVLQSLAAPIPAFIITLSNAVLFGWWKGAILSWSSAMVGAAVCFYIARILGRDAVAHFVSNTALETVDRFFDRYGTHAILICRLLPFMSFDYVSYAAGLTSMGFWKFFIATGIGQLPATIVYSYVGGTLTGGAQMLMVGLLVAFSVAILVFIIYSIFKTRHSDLMGTKKDAADDEQAAPKHASHAAVDTE